MDAGFDPSVYNPRESNFPLKERLYDAHIVGLIVPKLDRTIIFQEGVGLHKFPPRLRLRDNNLPPDLILVMNRTQSLIERPACVDISGRVPDMDLTQHALDRGFAVGDNFGAVNANKELFGNGVVLYPHDTISVLKDVFEYRKESLRHGKRLEKTSVQAKFLSAHQFPSSPGRGHHPRLGLPP